MAKSKNEDARPAEAPPAPLPAPVASANLPATLAPSSRVEGLDEVLPGQVNVPMLVLVQGTSKDVGEARVGEWLLRSTGKVYGTKVRIVPVSQFNTRGYFRKDEDAPACTSLDGRVPESGSSPADPRGVVYHDCGRCFFAQRHPDPKNPRSKLPSPCAAQINFLALVWGMEDEEIDRQLCRIRFKRSSWLCGSQIISNAQMNALRVKTLWGTLYELSTKIEEGGMGKYGVPSARVIGPIEKTFPNISEEARAYSMIWSKQRELLARESLAPDTEEMEGVAPADVHAAPASKGVAPNEGGPPVDDLPF